VLNSGQKASPIDLHFLRAVTLHRIALREAAVVSFSILTTMPAAGYTFTDAQAAEHYPILSRRLQEQRPAGHRHHAQGLNTKIHALCDALRFVLTTGQRHDSRPVPELLEGLADKAYDSDTIEQFRSDWQRWRRKVLTAHGRCDCCQSG